MNDKLFLIIDPCYVIRDKEWTDLVDKAYENSASLDATNILPYKIKGVGTMIEWVNTSNGDGTYKLGNRRVDVDSGTVSVIILNKSARITKVMKENAVIVDNEGDSQTWFERAMSI